MLRKFICSLCPFLKKIGKLLVSITFSFSLRQAFLKDWDRAILFDRISSGEYISTRMAV
jgi:hypothetical protein